MKFTKKALREYVVDALSGTTGTNDKQPVNVSDIVDPSKSLTDPSGDEHTPNSKQELQITVDTMLDDTEDDEAADTYKTLKKAMDDKNKMTKKSVEEVIRSQIKNLLDEESRFKTPKAVNSDVDTGVGDGASFEEIANELDISVSGAATLVDKIISKLQYVRGMDKDDLIALVGDTLKKYIKHLHSSGELSDEDLDLLVAHPNVVEDLPGFRDFLHAAIRRERRLNAKSDNE